MRTTALLILLLPLSLQAQPAHPRDGVATERTKDNTREIERTWRNDSLINEKIYDISALSQQGIYYTTNSGRLPLSEKNYRNGMPEGLFRTWVNGVLHLEGGLHKGVRHGHFTEWRADGTKWLEYDYVNGQLNGLRKEYDNADHVVFTSWYRNGVYDSLYTKYYDNGKKQAEWICKNGSFEGRYREWHPDGKLALEGIYRNDRREGEFAGFDSLGRKISSAMYVNDALNGPYVEWYGSGQKKLQQQFVNDSAVGSLRVWNKEGLRMRVPHEEVTYNLYSFYYQYYYPSPVQQVDESSFEALERRADSAVKPLGNVDRAPVFPGGEKKLRDTLLKSLAYPQVVANNYRPATVRLSFVIGTDGRVSDVRVLSMTEGMYGLDENTTGALKKLPRWQPAKRNGVPVPFRDEITFNFVFQ